MSKKTGYRTITYRFRLYCEHMDWLQETKQMYNRVLSFYYDVIGKEPEIWNVPKLKMMRQLELLTVGAREEECGDTKYPLPFEKVPLYFRRAAINDAIRLRGSFRTGEGQGARQAGSFHASPIYYKGMYKNFTATAICLKVYNGAKWVWEDCTIDTCGRIMPEEEQMMSPTIVLEKGRAMLHVPVKEEVEDVRTVKERIAGAGRLCAVYFPKDDVLSVAVLLSPDGIFLESRFFRGGKDLNHRRQLLLERLEQSRGSMGGKNGHLPVDENKKLKEKLYNIADDVAHRISRELVDYCKSKNVSIIIVPKYGANKDFVGSPYAIANSYDWIGRRIISYVKYKSFGDGIVTTTVSIRELMKQCHVCGAALKKNKKTYVCQNGHKGNLWLNIAMNEGKRFLETYRN